MRAPVVSLLLSFLFAFNIITTTTAGVTSSKVFPNLFDGDDVTATVLDPSTRFLYATTTTDDAIPLYRIRPNGRRAYKTLIPFPDDRPEIINNPMGIISDNLLVVLANGVGTDNSVSDCTMYFIDAVTGDVSGDFVRLEGPLGAGSHQGPSPLSAIKVIGSTANPNKVYVMATSFMGADLIRGYSTFRIDVVSRTIDWFDHYVPASSTDGGLPRDILEVNGSYLLVGGELGLVRYELDTGIRTEVIMPGTVVTHLLLVNDLVLVGAAGDDVSYALDSTTLLSQWAILGTDIVYHAPGPTTYTVWFTRDIRSSGSTDDSDVQVGVINLSDGSAEWGVQYDGGLQRIDNSVGFYATGGTVAYLGTVGVSVEEDNNNGGGCGFAQWFGVDFSDWFGGFAKKRQGVLVFDARVLTVDSSQQGIVDVNVNKAVQDPRVFAAANSLGWMVGDNGGGAIRYVLE